MVWQICKADCEHFMTCVMKNGGFYLKQLVVDFIMSRSN